MLSESKNTRKSRHDTLLAMAKVEFNKGLKPPVECY